MEESGFVSEVFVSIQGEGLYVGLLQLFVRTAGCSLGCSYCDTPESQGRTKRCVIIETGRSLDNPVDTRVLADTVEQIIHRTHTIHSISLTGGEPLEQPGFLESFLELTRRFGKPHYLETNGLHPEALERILYLVDIVSLDIKLPSLCGGEDLFSVYERTLPLLRDRELFCKIVIGEGFDPAEFEQASEMLSDFDPDLPLVIQPATPRGDGEPMDGNTLLDLYGRASARLRNVRIIPQCHRIMNVR